MDIEKLFPLLFESRLGCVKLGSLDDLKMAKAVDKSLVPDFPFGDGSGINLNYSEVYLPKPCVEALNKLYEDFRIEDSTIQLNLQYCLVSMINAKRLGFAPVKETLHDQEVFFSKGRHISDKLTSVTFNDEAGDPFVISSKKILAQIQQILSKYSWDDEQLAIDIDEANREKKIVNGSKSNSLIDANRKRYFFTIYDFLNGKIDGENKKKGIAQMMLYIIDFKDEKKERYYEDAINTGKKFYRDNKGVQLDF